MSAICESQKQQQLQKRDLQVAIQLYIFEYLRKKCLEPMKDLTNEAR